MLSPSASAGSTLTTYIPPGEAANDFRVSVVVYVSDILGSTAVTSLAEDGSPLSIVSTLPDEVCAKRNVLDVVGVIH